MEREAINIADYAGVEAGLRFFEACDRTFSLLASQPGMGVISYLAPFLIRACQRVKNMKERA
jgi:hypothetical protein